MGMVDAEFKIEGDALKHLGNGLYKNLYGILIEYITNSYDADASEVLINIDRAKKIISIKDNGAGMTLDELTHNFLAVGKNRREHENGSKSIKGRLLTGHKGMGKLAYSGFFDIIDVITIKNKEKSLLCINKGTKGQISENTEKSEEFNGTNITLSSCKKNIPTTKDLAEQISKRLNIMCPKESDGIGFSIFIESNNEKIEINKEFRDNIVFNKDEIKLDYYLPDDIARFTTDKKIQDYFKNNSISGRIIARSHTTTIKENQGIVLFARNKLCHNADIFGIAYRNSFGYSYLYGELHVDFIDENEDNIGTDRTALEENDLTNELILNIQAIIRGYASLYDDDMKKKKTKAINEFEKTEIYLNTKNRIDLISDEKIKTTINFIFEDIIKSSIDGNKKDEQKIIDFKEAINTIVPSTTIPPSERTDIVHDTIDAHRKLFEHIEKKYNYKGKDNVQVYSYLYSNKNEPSLAKVNAVLDKARLSADLKKDMENDMKNLIENLGRAFSALRNLMLHNNQRIDCLNKLITTENQQRMMGLVDLYIETDELLFKPNNDIK